MSLTLSEARSILGSFATQYRTKVEDTVAKRKQILVEKKTLSTLISSSSASQEDIATQRSVIDGLTSQIAQNVADLKLLRQTKTEANTVVTTTLNLPGPPPASRAQYLGVTGPAGQRGATGPAGPTTGYTGPAGPRGFTGMSGPSGVTGPSGTGGPPAGSLDLVPTNGSANMVTSNGVYSALQTKVGSLSSGITQISGNVVDSSVQLLLHGEGSTITDSGYYNRAVSVSAGVVTDASQYRFGSKSIYLPPNTSMNVSGITLGELDFTLEFYVRFDNVSTYKKVIVTLGDSSNGFTFSVSYGTTCEWYFRGATQTTSTNVSFNPGEWHHVALCRYKNIIQTFWDGKGTSIYYVSVQNIPSLTLTFANPVATYKMWLDEVKLTSGKCVYWYNNFTPGSFDNIVYPSPCTTGQLGYTQDNYLHLCTQGGSPGTWRAMKLYDLDYVQEAARVCW